MYSLPRFQSPDLLSTQSLRRTIEIMRTFRRLYRAQAAAAIPTRQAMRAALMVMKCFLTLSLACAAMPQPVHASRGCVKSWTTYEAEDGGTNGQVLTWNGDRGTPASEASGRSCVELRGPGSYVTVTTNSIVSNTILVRYNVPQSKSGTLGIYVNGLRRASVPLASEFINRDNGQPTNADGTPGNVCRFFDEVRCLLPIPIRSGSVVSLKLDSTSKLPDCIIDLVDLEQAPPALAQPQDSLSIASYGAVPNADADNYKALTTAIAAAQQQRKILWIPAGTWNVGRQVQVTGNVTVKGAGMWHTKLNFTTSHDGGFWMNGPNCRFFDFSLSGHETDRGETAKHAFGGSGATGSALRNVWIEHFCCGFWMGLGGVSYNQGFLITGCRIRDTMADGINCCSGTSGTVISDCEARGTGDDAFAVYPARDHGTLHASHDNTIKNCTAECVWNANGFAIYGGYDNDIIDCVASDIAVYCGVNVASIYEGFPFTGSNVVNGVTLVRCGGYYWGSQQFGGIFFISGGMPIRGVTLENVDIDSPRFFGIKIANDNAGSTDNLFKNIKIRNAGIAAVTIYGSAPGDATFENVISTGTGSEGLLNTDKNFKVIRGVGNSGW